MIAGVRGPRERQGPQSLGQARPSAANSLGATPAARACVSAGVRGGSGLVPGAAVAREQVVRGLRAP